MFGLSKFKLIAYAVAAVLLLTGGTTTYLVWRHKQRMIGWNAAIEEVKTKNAEAKKAANAVVRSVDECEAQGGSWNVSTGDCDR